MIFIFLESDLFVAGVVQVQVFIVLYLAFFT